MPRCGFVKPDGRQCRRIVGASESYCYSHDPDRASERARNASKAARFRGSPVREIRDLKYEVRGVIRAVREEGFDRNDTKVIFACGVPSRSQGTEMMCC